MKRIHYLLLVAYWSARHLSFARGRWVADYEFASFHPARKWVAPTTEKQSHHLPADVIFVMRMKDESWNLDKSPAGPVKRNYWRNCRWHSLESLRAR